MKRRHGNLDGYILGLLLIFWKELKEVIVRWYITDFKEKLSPSEN